MTQLAIKLMAISAIVCGLIILTTDTNENRPAANDQTLAKVAAIKITGCKLYPDCKDWPQ